MSENRGASVDGVDVRCWDWTRRSTSIVLTWDRDRWYVKQDLFLHYYDDGAMGPGAD